MFGLWAHWLHWNLREVQGTFWLAGDTGFITAFIISLILVGYYWKAMETGVSLQMSAAEDELCDLKTDPQPNYRLSKETPRPVPSEHSEKQEEGL